MGHSLRLHCVVPWPVITHYSASLAPVGGVAHAALRSSSIALIQAAHPFRQHPASNLRGIPVEFTLADCTNAYSRPWNSFIHRLFAALLTPLPLASARDRRVHFPFSPPFLFVHMYFDRRATVNAGHVTYEQSRCGAVDGAVSQTVTADSARSAAGEEEA